MMEADVMTNPGNRSDDPAPASGTARTAVPVPTHLLGRCAARPTARTLEEGS